MKSTGIVRRIDDLGRVVIPKEIRKTFRIKVGAPLEIFIGRENQIVFRKYNPIVDLSEHSDEYAEALAESLICDVFISDEEKVISVAGFPKKMIGQSVGRLVKEALEEKASVFVKEEGMYDLLESEENYLSYIIEPIVSDDVMGAIVAVIKVKDKNKGKKFNEADLTSIKIAAGFLAKQTKNKKVSI